MSLSKIPPSKKPDVDNIFSENKFGIAPYPLPWKDFHQHLSDLICEKYDEPLRTNHLSRLLKRGPLLLSGWNLSNDNQKKERLIEQLKFMFRLELHEQAIAWLRDLPPEQWYYGSDGPTRDYTVSFSADLTLRIDASDEDEAAALAIRSLRALESISTKISFDLVDTEINDLRVHPNQ